VKKTLLCIYGGRFQPPHIGHYNVYLKCKELFENVFVATGGRVDMKKSFLSFEDKKIIWKQMFDVDIDYSVSPAFQPKEIVERYENPVYLTITSEKDKKRFVHSDYYRPYPVSNGMPSDFDLIKDQMETFDTRGYYYVMPMQGDISGTKIREAFQSDNKKEFFTEAYGFYNENVFERLNTIMNLE
jgi:nicotinamide mononucleotide adenylyltransferase